MPDPELPTAPTRRQDGAVAGRAPGRPMRLAALRDGRFWVPAALALLAVLVKLPTLDTPAYWDEMAWVEQAHWLSKGSLLRVVPGLRPASAFWGHPPGLHLTVAAIWKLVGYSLSSAHLLIAAFSALGVVSVFLLGRLLGDGRTGLLAALCLLACPVYVAQSGQFLADLPLAALAPLMVYLGLRERYAAYVVCASSMVLIKETSIALVVAFLAYLLLRHGPRSVETWRRILRYSVPLWVIGSFFLVQKLTTGHFFFIYDFKIDLFELDPRMVADQARIITRWVFLEQHRYLVTLLIAAALVIDRSAWKRQELLLFVLVMGVFGYAFSILLLLPRYLLPVLPFFYLLGARSVLAMLPWRRLQSAAAVLLLIALAWSLRSDPFWGSGEFNLTYLDVVRLNREMSGTIERQFPDARVLAAWPQSRQLQVPDLGYVTKPVRVAVFQGQMDPDADLIFTSVPWTGPRLTLRQLAQEHGWPLLQRYEAGEVVTELYGRPGKPP